MPLTFHYYESFIISGNSIWLRKLSDSCQKNFCYVTKFISEQKNVMKLHNSVTKFILHFNVHLWKFLEISPMHVSIISFSFDFGDTKNRYCLECRKLLVCSWNRTLFMFMFYIYEAFGFFLCCWNNMNSSGLNELFQSIL